MIGTLSEGPIHSYLKYYIEPNPIFHEQRVGTFIADILKPFPADNGILSVEGHIYEIQTASLYRLIPKLEAFLKLYEVTVVLPVTLKMDFKRSVYSIFYELYSIKRFLTHPNIRIQICRLETEVEITEVKSKKGKLRKKVKKRIITPKALTDEMILSCPQDYRALLPAGLPEKFTSKDFSKCAKITLDLSRSVLNVLRYVGAIEQIEKEGNSLVYIKS